MRRIWILAVAFFPLINSCGPSAEVERDPSVNLSNYKTYAWVETSTTKDNNSGQPAAFAELSIRNAVDDQLQKKGWRLVESNPDVLLSYDVLVERNVEERNDPVYTQPFLRYYYNPFFRRWGTIYYPSRFVGYDSYTVPVREATVTISMMDARTDKKIWQGWSTQDVNSKVLTKNEIRSGVKSIFRKFEENA